MSEKQLIKALKNGDEEAFERIYYQYQHLVYFVIYSILKNKENSEEIMQDTFLKMYQQISTFDGRYFQAWLLKIAKNLALNRYHQEKRTIVFEDYMEAETPSHDQKNWELMCELESILNESEYQVVILTIIYNLKQREIAEYLDKPLGTVSWLYNQGLKKLKKYYARKEKKDE